MTTPTLPPGPWRWLTDNTLVAFHGGLPVVLGARFVDDLPALVTQGCDGEPAPLTPEHPVAKAIAALPELVEALMACRDELRYWLPIKTCTCACAEAAAKKADAALEKAGLK